MIEVMMTGEVWNDVEPGTEALLQAWQVKEGEQVEAGQVLVSAELVKTTHDITAPAAGRVSALLAAEGDTIGPATVLARLEA
ncbi:MAG TPA: lipoyl domain-containing protein [Burkholderiaceae bacterium]|nr:lipoyl domain-containing protein [Burkholderiaceae bacterium]